MAEQADLLPGTLDLLWAKFYRLTAAGRRRLGEEVASWNRLVEAIALALAASPREV